MSPLVTARFQSHDVRDPPRGNAPIADRPPPDAPREEAAALKDNYKSGSYLGTTKRLPEFNLNDKVVLVTGAARGLGLVQAEALLEAGATVYALDRLPEPSPDFYRVQKRAAAELGTTLHYRQIDVRDVPQLNEIIRNISETQGKLDGLIAAAGIQQETPALDYTAKDANTMFEVNITGVFMTAQAVAKEMIRHGRGGSIAMIASMSGSVANRVSLVFLFPRCSFLHCNWPNRFTVSSTAQTDLLPLPGSNLPGLQCFQSRRYPACEESRLRMGWSRYPREHYLARLHRHGHGRSSIRAVPGAKKRLAHAEHAWQAQQA